MENCPENNRKKQEGMKIMAIHDWSKLLYGLVGLVKRCMMTKAGSPSE